MTSARSFLSRRRARRSFSRSVRRDAWMLAHRGQTRNRSSERGKR